MKKLYVIPTPIGNLDDASKSITDALGKSEIIFCEDTRRTGLLISKLEMEKKKLISYNNFNEKERLDIIKNSFEKYDEVGIVSDAGAPTISDPGYIITKLAVEMGVKVIPISGPSSIINIAMASAMSYKKLSFVGFLPKKQSEIENIFSNISDQEMIIFFESPLRIKKTLELISGKFQNNEICIGREMTKMHEEFIRGSAIDILENDFKCKGEFTVSLMITNEKKQYDDSEIKTLVDNEIKKENSVKDSIVIVSKKTNVNKNTIYKIYHS